MDNLKQIIENETIRLMCSYYGVDWSDISRHQMKNREVASLFIRRVCEYCLVKSGEISNALAGKITGVTRQRVSQDISDVESELFMNTPNGKIASKIIENILFRLNEITRSHKEKILFDEIKKYRRILGKLEREYVEVFGEVPTVIKTV